jgi:mannose-6-phosphate isomerase-like protein (cupin superfamily)
MSSTATALQPRITTADTADRIRPFGIDMKLMIGSEHTGGTFSAVIAEVKPGEGPPPHFHTDREEYFFVLEGTYDLSVNGTTSQVGPGTLVFVPRGTTHAFTNVSTTDGRILEWTIPGDNADYFRAVDAMQAGGGFDPGKFAAINQRYATEFVR